MGNNGGVPRDGGRGGTKCSYLLSMNILLLVIQILVPALYYSLHSSVGSTALLETASGGNSAKAPGSGVPPPPPPLSRQQKVLTKATEGENGGDSSRRGPASGTFNGFNVYYRDPSASPDAAPLHSTVHCMGENFGERSWLYRSCEFRNLCFDMIDREFVLFRSAAERSMNEAFLSHEKREYVSLSSSMENVSVSLGGINPQWGWKPNQSEALEYWPTVIEDELNEGYYELASDKVMVTFHSMAAVNVGHLLWDDFFPIFTLLDMFQLARNDLVLIRYVLKNRPRALWATCDLRDNTQQLCRKFFGKFLPLLGVKAEKQHTIYDSILELYGGQEPKSKYVCSPKGAVGIGMLTDHGLKTHGWDKSDYESTHNIGRGRVMYEFRNFMIRNLGMDPSPPVSSDPPYKVVFSLLSSKDPDRHTDFHAQIEALESAFAEDSKVIVEAYRFKDLTLEQEVQKAMDASIFVTACGGGAMTSMFLPKGGSAIVYYPERPTSRQTGKHKHPARLDWDYLNNMGYARVHWLPTTSMDERNQLSAFVQLIQNEIETISHH